MALASALLIIAPWFFSCQLVDAKVTFPVDIAMILMPDWRAMRSFYVDIADKFFEHFEFGADKARMALINGFLAVEKEEVDLVLQNLTADVPLLKKKLGEWNRTRFLPRANFAAAFRVLSPQLIANSSDRAKVVFMVMTMRPTDDQMDPVLTTSKQLRDKDFNIYVVVQAYVDPINTRMAPNITGDQKKVFEYEGIHFDQGIVNMTDQIFKQMDADLASRPTIPPKPGPTQLPTQPPTKPSPEPPPPPQPEPTPTSEPPPAKETTTSPGNVAKPAPPLQWASCLLIGLAFVM